MDGARGLNTCSPYKSQYWWDDVATHNIIKAPTLNVIETHNVIENDLHIFCSCTHYYEQIHVIKGHNVIMAHIGECYTVIFISSVDKLFQYFGV